MRLDAALSEQAVSNEILSRTGTTDVTLAAWAIHDIVNENMVRAARLHCLEHGVDPGKVTVIATGGAGPVHAGWLLEKLNAAQVICPPSAAVASALGLLLAPRTLEASATRLRPMDEVTDDELRSRLGQIEDKLRAEHPDEQFTSTAWVQMRLIGQGYELPIDVPEERTVSSLAFAFDSEYTARYGRPPWSGKREIISWGVRLKRERHVESTTGTLADVPVGAPRSAYFGPGYGWITTPVFNHDSLRAKGRVNGPLFVAEQGTTIVVTPGQLAYCDEWNNVHIEPLPAELRPAAGVGAGQTQEVGR
jgi:N-methylhydantoinase A